MTMPQLRVRSEFSFKKAYGSPSRIAERLAAINCPSAGIVDSGGTWGHVKFEKAMLAAGLQPMFGAEFNVHIDDGLEERRKFKTDWPVAWCLADDLSAFYEFSSSTPTDPGQWADATGIIRFSGSALKDPACFDYVDINPASILRCKQNIELAARTCRPLVLTCDNNYPSRADAARYLAVVDGKKTTIQHIPNAEEMRQAFWFLDDRLYHYAMMGTLEVAERLQGKRLPKSALITAQGNIMDNVREGKAYRLAAKHIKEWTQAYEDRLQLELGLIADKGFESYFLVVADLVLWAKQHMLVGPARGSSAGSLVCYLLRITEVDPLVHHLLFERFIDINRNDLPDIDIDFSDTHRDECFVYLAQKYGQENVARLGNVNTLKPRSVMAEVGKRLGIPANATFAVRNVLIEYSSGDSRYGKGLEDTLLNTRPGQDFVAKYPESELMGEVEGHVTHTGIHAAGVLVSNTPVTHYCTVKEGIAQIDKIDAEYLNMLKIDALGLRTLGVIEDTGCVSNELLYGLTLDDPEVLKILDEHKFSGVFQFEGGAQRRVSMQVPMTDFTKIDHVTALARPGPLGGGAANIYINRNMNREETTFRHPSMVEYLGDTFGVVLYQEQVMRIVREIGKFTWEETSVIRKAMSGRKGKEFFDRRGEIFAEGAESQGIDQDTAKLIWNEICNFGAWGMNRSHTVSYAMISYWCCYMKRYHPIEYAAACLRNAKDDVQTVEILRELSAEGVGFIPFDPVLSQRNWSAQDGKLVGGFTNLAGIGPAKAEAYVQKRETTGLTAADIDKLRSYPVKNSELRPAHAMWGDYYQNPHKYNIAGKVREFADLEDWERCVVVCKLVSKERRDENETVRRQRRGGDLRTGQTQFLDAFVVDDSVSKPVVLRIKPDMWHTHGEKMADRAIDGQDWFLVRGKWLYNFSMLTVMKIKCLTQPDMFD